MTSTVIGNGRGLSERETDSATTDVDVVVVGGSVAGLQAAMTLGRACRRVVVIDAGHPRNLPARHVHNFLGHDRLSPSELLCSAAAMLADYDVIVKEQRVVDIHHDPDQGSLVVAAEDGTAWRARAVILATGLVDELPKVPGVAVLWGGDVVACPHCHGWEVRNEPLGVLGTPDEPRRAVERAVLVSRWSSRTTLFTDGVDLPAADRDRLLAAHVSVSAAPVRRLDHSGGRLQGVVLEGDVTVPCRTVFVVTRQTQQTEFSRALGCRAADPAKPTGPVWSDALGRTSIPGVWAAGTSTQPALLAIGAAGHASSVAVALHAELTDDDLVPTSRERQRL